MTLREILAKKDALKTKGLAILKAAKEREDKALTAEEQAEYDGIMGEIAALEAEAKLLAEEQELERAAGAEAFRGDPLPITVHGRAEDDPSGGFRSHTEFLTSVMRVETDKVVDPRLERFRAVQGDDEQSTTQSPYGGFLVPSAVMPGLLTVTPEADPLEARTRSVPMEAERVYLNARVDKDHSSSVSGGLVVTRRPETADGESSRMKFEQIVLDANELFGFAFASEKLMRSSPSSFAAILQSGFGDEFASHKFFERLWGSGVGEPLGVLSAPSGATVTVAKETGQAADTVVKENIDKMASRCWRYAMAIWLANYDTLPQLLSLHQDVGTGGNVVPYFQNITGQMMLLGRPLYLTEYASKVGDKGDILLGTWSEYLDGMRGGIMEATSIHVRFLSNQTAFKFWMENDGKPWWTTALTQKKGGASLSPFVTLAARA